MFENQNGVNRVIDYILRTFSESEQRYHFHSGKVEFLSLNWSVTERFKDYLKFGSPFIVATDNNPVTYILSSVKLNAVCSLTLGERSCCLQLLNQVPTCPMDIKKLKRDCTETVDHRCLDAVLSGVSHHVTYKLLHQEGQASTAAIHRGFLMESRRWMRSLVQCRRRRNNQIGECGQLWYIRVRHCFRAGLN